MTKKLSILFTALVMTVCCAFALTTAYADETPSDVSDSEQQISIRSSNTVLGISAGTYNYNGTQRKPNTSVTYTDSDGKKTVLTKGTDYTVTYSNNINAGTATVKIEGNGKYNGSLSKNFTIKPVSISSNTTITLNYTNAVYNGALKTPIPTIYWNNGGKKIKLVRGIDYTVSYSNNRNMGQPVITIKGTKNFTGTVKKYFRILPAKTTGLKATKSTANSVTLSWNNQKGVSGYQVLKYDTKKKKYVQVKRLSGNAKSCTVTGLNASTAYHFKVRAFIQLSDGKTNFYGAYSNDAARATTPVRITTTSVAKSGTSITVKWKTTKSTGYQIFYSTDKNFKKSYKCITLYGASRSSYTIRNVNKNSTYYVKVRAYINYKGVANKGICSTPKATNSSYSYLYATYSSNYVNNANRTNNLKLASKAITGTIVQPGQTFSFNKVVGPRTISKGYKAAPVFSGGGVENGIGGGICQVSSTVFNCALNANVGIVERHQHSQRVTYVPLGRDAAIYGTTQDFRWKNTTNYPIKIVMTVSGGKITCKFYTNENVKPAKVSLKVTQSGRNFTLRRTVGGKVNYTCRSNY